MKPTIGVTAGFKLSSTKPAREQVYLNASYVDAIYGAGGIPSPLLSLRDPKTGDLDALLDRVDGLLMTGGPDLNPRHYGQPLHAKTECLHPRRDAFDIALFKRADERDIPTLCICLGHQIAHVARGGKLIQHLEEPATGPAVRHSRPEGGDAFHDATLEAGSRLAEVVGTTRLEINSRHHQAVDGAYPGKNLRLTGRAEDGVIEASEDPASRFLVTVQWHPEDLLDRGPHRALFEALVAAAIAFAPQRSAAV